MNVAIVVLLFGVVRSDISQTNPPPDICLCVDHRNCNVRDSACGDVTDLTTTNNCYIFTGQKTDCSDSGQAVSYFETNFNGKSGWIEGNNLIFGNGPECGIPDNCTSIYCQNGGNCFNRIDGYVCDCVPGFAGSHCEIDIDECISNPCQNGGTCKEDINRYNCSCRPGFDGAACELDIDECISNPCQNGGTCNDDINRYNCSCRPGFDGAACELDIDECISNPCQNGGTCKDDINRFNCSCRPGFDGAACELDIDECISNPCQNGGTCKDDINRYNCSCRPGFNGAACELDINECLSNPCRNGGTCTDQINGYVCTCVCTIKCFTGLQCQTGFTVLILRNDVAGSNANAFNLPWARFTQEFGNPATQYWIGLERLYQATQINCQARFDLQSLNGTWYYAQYSSFKVGDSSTNYRLTINGFSGNTYNAMGNHNGYQFSTYDRDNDVATNYNCAQAYLGGFWFHSCVSAGVTISPANAYFNWYGTNNNPDIRLNVVLLNLIC